MSEVRELILEVYGSKEDFDGTSNYFETDQAITDTPTLTFTLATKDADTLERVKITDVSYYLKPTNSVTYQLYLFEDADADNVESLSHLVFDSGAAKASDTVYKNMPASGKTPFYCNVGTDNTLYYLINWSGAPGDTLGYIRVRGEIVK